MRTQNLVLGALLLALLAGLVWLALSPPPGLSHRVPTRQWRVMRHYATNGTHQDEMRFVYRESP
jgi:hypothetical protein